jgi:histone H2A
MSGKGRKSGKSGSGKASSSESKVQSHSAKVGLQFPVGRVHHLLKCGNYAQCIGAGAPGPFILANLFVIPTYLFTVYLAAVLEYLAAEILELAGNAACDHKKLECSNQHSPGSLARWVSSCSCQSTSLAMMMTAVAGSSTQQRADVYGQV